MDNLMLVSMFKRKPSLDENGFKNRLATPSAFYNLKKPGYRILNSLSPIKFTRVFLCFFGLLIMPSCGADSGFLYDEFNNETFGQDISIEDQNRENGSDSISANEIITFRLLSEDNAGITTDIEGVLHENEKIIVLELDAGEAALENMVPTITVSKNATIHPSSKSSQDFSNGVSYKITLEDGTEIFYEVIVDQKPCPQKRIASGAIMASSNNQRIENLHIKVSDQDGIVISNYAGVTISNCIIEYTGSSRGIVFSNAHNLTIKNSYVKYTNAPSKGSLPDASRNCIEGFKSNNLVLYNVKVEDGSTGVRLDQCDDAKMMFIEGHNMRGPFPRGQLVQFDKCRGGVLSNFSVINDRNIAWTEDNISIYKSGGQQIRKGLIIGNNSPTGVGVLFEDQNTSGARGGFGGVVEDVDFLEMGNGVVSSVEGSRNVTFRRIRAKQVICGNVGQGRGNSKSNSLIFAAFGTEAGKGGNKILDSYVYGLCNPDNVVWPKNNFTTIDYRSDVDFKVRNPIVLNFDCTTDN